MVWIIFDCGLLSEFFVYIGCKSEFHCSIWLCSYRLDDEEMEQQYYCYDNSD
jgi:hypothetical protein